MEQTSESNLHFLDYWRVIRSRKEVILAVMLLVVVTGTGVTLMLPKQYAADARILVREDNMDVDVFERQMPQGYNPFFLRTQYEIIQSRQILYQVINNLNLQQVWGEKNNEDGSPIGREDAYITLRSSVKVQQYRDTSIIAIIVYRESPEEAARIANEIAAVYRDHRLSMKRRETKRAIEVLENEVQKQEEKVTRAEDELERIRKDLGVSMITTGVRADKMRLQQLEADRISARVDMIVRKARLDQLDALNGDELMNASSYIVNDQALASVRAQLVDSEVTLRVMLETYGLNHPEVKRIQAGVNELKRKLTEALAGLKKGLKADYEVSLAKFNALETELETAKKSDIDAESEKFLPFEKADREVEAQRQILNALRARVAQQGIEVEVPRTPVEVVDTAEPPQRPVSPNLILNILISVFLGLAAGIGLAYFIEYLDTSVKTVDDVESYLGLPVLGPRRQQGDEAHRAGRGDMDDVEILALEVGQHVGCLRDVELEILVDGNAQNADGVETYRTGERVACFNAMYLEPVVALPGLLGPLAQRGGDAAHVILGIGEECHAGCPVGRAAWHCRATAVGAVRVAGHDRLVLALEQEEEFEQPAEEFVVDLERGEILE